MKVSIIMLAGIFLISMPFPVGASSVDVSGYTDRGIHVSGELDVNSDGSVDGDVYTDSGRSIHVEGDLESGGSVEIDNDSWGGSGYELDVD